MTRVLVAEDDAMIAEGLRDDLEQEGYAVEWVADGEAAARALRDGRFDLAVLDIMLPGGSGIDICRAARSAGVYTPVIMLTARGAETDRVAGLKAGADDYVVKPFSPRELLARVEAVLRRPGVGRSGQRIWEAGTLRVDFDAGRADRDGTPIELTATEIRLLSLLHEHRGSTLSLDAILKGAWGPGIFLTDRVVYTHINNLRRKIERDPAAPELVISVRGLGYRLDG